MVIARRYKTCEIVECYYPLLLYRWFCGIYNFSARLHLHFQVSKRRTGCVLHFLFVLKLYTSIAIGSAKPAIFTQFTKLCFEQGSWSPQTHSLLSFRHINFQIKLRPIISRISRGKKVPLAIGQFSWLSAVRILFRRNKQNYTQSGLSKDYRAVLKKI